MAQYIPKDALLAEIERRMDAALMRQRNLEAIGQETILNEMVAFNLNRIISFIDTLEVKDGELEKETDKYFADWTTDPEYGDAVKPNCYGCSLDDCKDIAKHFFEFGLSVNNPITAADRGTAEEIIINLKRVEQDYRIDLTKEIEWIRNKVKKGK